MNSLFIRTLLWFLATIVLTFIAIAIAAALDIDPGERRRGPFGSMLTLQANEAAHAYETGGRDALRAVLERFRSVTDTDSTLTDSSGRDLLTGEDRSDLTAEVRRQSRGPFWRRNRTVMARSSEDDRYMYFSMLEWRNVVRWFLQPEINLTILALLTVLSYAFARHLTNPVLKLQSVVECFGRGELAVRSRFTRKDEIGGLSRTFDRMADRIETLLRAERRLLLDISHELRSPLARLAVAVELARTAEAPEKHLDRIEKEGERLNDLVSQLLQVTRAEGDASRMRREEVSLTELVGDLAADARLEAEARGCGIEWLPGNAVTLHADAELLRRAIENVVRNAVRHAPQGTAVEIELRQESGCAAISVRDRGPGVPEERLPRIFDAFYRADTDRNRSSGGAGLGLAIARRAVELHGGRIEARNAAPGLLVEIQLPL